MSLAHVMRQTGGVGDEERGYCLMSWLSKRSPLSLRHPRAYPREKSIGHNAPVRDRLRFADKLLGLAPSKRDRSSGITLIEELRSESLNPLSAWYK